MPRRCILPWYIGEITRQKKELHLIASISKILFWCVSLTSHQCWHHCYLDKPQRKCCGIGTVSFTWFPVSSLTILKLPSRIVNANFLSRLYWLLCDDLPWIGFGKPEFPSVTSQGKDDYFLLCYQILFHFGVYWVPPLNSREQSAIYRLYLFGNSSHLDLSKRHFVQCIFWNAWTELPDVLIFYPTFREPNVSTNNEFYLAESQKKHMD